MAFPRARPCCPVPGAGLWQPGRSAHAAALLQALRPQAEGLLQAPGRPPLPRRQVWSVGEKLAGSPSPREILPLRCLPAGLARLQLPSLERALAVLVARGLLLVSLRH